MEKISRQQQLKPSILVQKRKIFDSKGWRRYYSKIKVDLNKTPIYSERDLCWMIYKLFGEGHYMVMAWKKKRKGFWVFWKGDITKDGFEYEVKNTGDAREVRLLQNELDEEEDEEYREMLKDMIKEEKKLIKSKRPGFLPYLKPSGRRGQFIFWEDADA